MRWASKTRPTLQIFRVQYRRFAGLERSEMKRFRSRLPIVLLLAGIIGCQRSTALRWGADEEGGAPYVTKDAATGQYQGFEVDLANALAKEMGRPIVFKQYEYKKLIDGLRRGDIDLAMNGLEVTPDRQTQVRFQPALLHISAPARWSAATTIVSKASKTSKAARA